VGVRSFLKGKLDKHGGPVGLAKHAVTRATGNSGGSTGGGHVDPAAELKTAFSGLPELPDPQGFVAVAPSNLLAEGSGSTFKAGETPVACFRIDGKVYVIDDECAHENGPVGEGQLDGFVVTCPYHNWRYDVRNGDCLTNKERFLSCFAVKEEGGYIWVGRKLREGTHSRGGEHDDGLTTRNIKVD